MKVSYLRPFYNKKRFTRTIFIHDGNAVRVETVIKGLIILLVLGAIYLTFLKTRDTSSPDSIETVGDVRESLYFKGKPVKYDIYHIFRKTRATYRVLPVGINHGFCGNMPDLSSSPVTQYHMADKVEIKIKVTVSSGKERVSLFERLLPAKGKKKEARHGKNFAETYECLAMNDHGDVLCALSPEKSSYLQTMVHGEEKSSDGKKRPRTSSHSLLIIRTIPPRENATEDRPTLCVTVTDVNGYSRILFTDFTR